VYQAFGTSFDDQNGDTQIRQRAGVERSLRILTKRAPLIPSALLRQLRQTGTLSFKLFERRRCFLCGCSDFVPKLSHPAAPFVCRLTYAGTVHMLLASLRPIY